MIAPREDEGGCDLRKIVMTGFTYLALAACGQGDKQANALDRAASQSDPAAAAELRNQADSIRVGADDSNVADPNSPAQKALSAAGNVAAASSASGAHARPVDPQSGTSR